MEYLADRFYLESEQRVQEQETQLEWSNKAQEQHRSLHGPVNDPNDTMEHLMAIREKAMKIKAVLERRAKAVASSKARHQAMVDLGMVRVQGAMGGVYYE